MGEFVFANDIIAARWPRRFAENERTRWCVNVPGFGAVGRLASLGQSALVHGSYVRRDTVWLSPFLRVHGANRTSRPADRTNARRRARLRYIVVDEVRFAILSAHDKRLVGYLALLVLFFYSHGTPACVAPK